MQSRTRADGFEPVFSAATERAFRKSAQTRPFTKLFRSVAEVVGDLKARGLLSEADRAWAAQTYGAHIFGDGVSV